MSEDKKKRLEAAIAKRDAVQRETQRLQGKLEAAKEEVARIEEECRSKGLDPAKLDESILKLEQRYEQAVSELEVKVAKAEADLAPFLREDG